MYHGTIDLNFAELRILTELKQGNTCVQIGRSEYGSTAIVTTDGYASFKHVEIPPGEDAAEVSAPPSYNWPIGIEDFADVLEGMEEVSRANVGLFQIHQGQHAILGTVTLVSGSAPEFYHLHADLPPAMRVFADERFGRERKFASVAEAVTKYGTVNVIKGVPAGLKLIRDFPKAKTAFRMADIDCADAVVDFVRIKGRMVPKIDGVVVHESDYYRAQRLIDAVEGSKAAKLGISSWTKETTEPTLPGARPSPERIRDLLLYDTETGDLRWRISRPGVKVGRLAGGRRDYGYRVISLDGKLYAAAELVWVYVYGRWPEGSIRHIDRNPANNTIANLKECEAFDWAAARTRLITGLDLTGMTL